MADSALARERVDPERFRELGSAALLVLTVAQAGTARDGLIYMLLFGVGSMIGMAALSSMIAVPLVMSARLLTAVNRALQFVVGSVAIGVGATTIFQPYWQDDL